MTQAQADAALLTISDMPTGWTQKQPTSSTKSTTKVEPASCQALFDTLKPKNSGGKVEAEASFSQGGFGVELDETVTSFADGSQQDKVEPLAKVLSQCSTFVTTSASGQSVSFTASPLSFPNLGDQTLAIRLNGKVQGINAVADLVVIATDHNLITLTTAGLAPLDGDKLEGIARKATARLAAAA